MQHKGHHHRGEAPADIELSAGKRASRRTVAASVAACLAVTGNVARAANPLPTPCAGVACSGAAFVAAGHAGAAISGNNLTVTQTTNSAILNWADFNIANGYTVTFAQPSATAATLNNIFSASPSVIAGRLNANGQVYLYNQNGIVFDNGAQVDAGGLVATTLQLPNALFLAGILSQPYSSGSTPPPVFQAASTTNGTISVNPGATLATADGGRIMLLGSAVTNAGKISTPDGQTILGAGNTVYLAAATDPALRGLLIEVNGNALTNAVSNSGQISADRGNITLAGLIVKQSGTLTATTSVSANGSIYLVAGDTSNPADTGFYTNATDQSFGTLLPNNGGQLILAPGSVTQVLPDATDSATLTGLQQQNFITSQIGLVGGRIYLQGNASVLAPGGYVGLTAAADPNLYWHAFGTNLVSPQADGTSRIYLDAGSSIDVAGLTNIPVPVTSNILTVTLESNDLQDDPLLRSGFLHGLSVTFNASAPLPTLFNAQPYLNNIGVGIDQMLTTGGSISLNSAGDTIVRSGASLNISGGSIAYQGGYAAPTTKLLGANGVAYDISSAPNNIQYVGLANSYKYTDPTWGTTTSDSTQTYYAGYLQGANAGQIQVESPQSYLMGQLIGGVTPGPYQRAASTLPLGGSLVIGAPTAAAIPDYRAPAVLLTNELLSDGLGSNFNYTDTSTLLPTAQQSLLELSPAALASQGFNRLSIYSNGTVTIPANTTINLTAAGSFQVTSLAGIELGGSISIPGGTVSLATKANQPVDNVSHDIDLAPDAFINVTGNWVNDTPSLNPLLPATPIVPNGGSISIIAAGSLSLGEGSSINASGGGYINPAGKLSPGAGGSISLAAKYTADSSGFPPYSGAVNLSDTTTLSAYSLTPGQGGTLSLQSGYVTVGTSASGEPGETILSAGFFQQGGFKAFAIDGLDGVMLGSASAPVLINPQQLTLVPTANPGQMPTGTNLLSFTTPQLLPQYLRAPANLSFSSAVTFSGLGDITLNAGSSIVTDPRGSVSLSVNGLAGNLEVLGQIVAPGGDINLTLGNASLVANPAYDSVGYDETQQLFLGPQAQLLATGYAQINTANPLGYREGQVFSGGTISLQANKGYLLTSAGSVIDVSGAEGTLDIQGAGSVTPTLVAGNAGSINLDAREGLVIAGALRGFAPDVAGAAGGTLSVGLDLFNYENTALGDMSIAPPYPLTQRNLILTSLPVGAIPPITTQATGLISTQTLNSGGFDAIALKSADLITLQGTIELSPKASLVLDAPILAASPGATSTLSSAYVGLGNYYNQASQLNPATSASLGSVQACAGAGCSGQLNVSAQLIDIRGESVWTGFASESVVSSGDIRLAPAETPLVTGLNSATQPSSLEVSGNLTFKAAQVYPTTATTFNMTVGGELTLLPNGTAPSSTPLSAGGDLTLTAASIAQDGVLRAPLGEITLSATGSAGVVALGAGSLTSVAADGATLPYGATVNGTQWTYSPGSGITQVIAAPPSKAITLQGANVTVQTGANVDLSGGGDLSAYEWIAGPGGSKDVLAANGGVYTYAILPSLTSTYAPIDPQFGSTLGATSGQTVFLSGVPGLNAGYYALLPARYALLPGAYAVKVVATNSDLPQGTALLQPDGSYVVAGQLGVPGTSDLSSRTSSFLLVPNAVVETQSQYTNTTANGFYFGAATASGTAAPRLPADAGLLQLSATSGLTLEGSINFSAGSFISGTDSNGKAITQSGNGGVVSLIAPQIQIVDEAASGTGVGANPSGTLQVSAKTLDALNAQTLVLGATDTGGSEGDVINVSVTQSVELQNTNQPLSAPQIILAALDAVTLDAGAKLSAAGTLNQTPATLTLQGGGAFLRVASGGISPIIVDSTVPQGPGGLLSIGAGTTVSAGAGSLQMYSTGGTLLDPTSSTSAASVGVFSTRVSLGDVPTGALAPGGLTLTTQLLTQLTGLTDLTLGSSSTIDLYGAVQLGELSGLKSLTLDAGAIAGYGSGDKTLQAGSISLLNTGNIAAAFTAPPEGTGSLILDATAANGGVGQITLGSGAKQLSGFGSVAMTADGYIQAQGTGTLTITSAAAGATTPLTLQSAALAGASGAQQSISTAGTISVETTPSPVANPRLPSPGLGAALSLQGSAIQDNGAIILPAGNLNLHATAGDLVLGPAASVTVAAATESFGVATQVASAGQITLQSDAGNITLASGSQVSLAGASVPGASMGGSAGTLTLVAPAGQVTLSGTLLASAPVGQVGGNFNLDTAAIGSFSTLNAQLAADGFNGQVSERARTGDVTIASTDTVTASGFQLVADQGSITVAGGINAAGSPLDANTSGNNISLWAANNLTVLPGATLNTDAAFATTLSGASTAGSITLSARQGTLDLRGGLFSLAGRGSISADGTLTLQAARTSDQTGLQLTAEAAEVTTGKPIVVDGVQTYYLSSSLPTGTATLGAKGQGDVLLNVGGAAVTTAAGYPVYQNLSIGTAGTLYGQAATFANSASTIAAELAPGLGVTAGNIEVRPAIDIVSTTNLTLSSNWDLGVRGAWHPGGAPIDLTFQSAGNMVFSGSLSDGFSTAASTASTSSVLSACIAGANCDSASYQVTAGADLGSAYPGATVSQAAPGTGITPTGNVVLAPGNLIRTGDGTISINAGGDVLMGYDPASQSFSKPGAQTSVIYTAGVPDPLPASDASLFVSPTGVGRAVVSPSFATDGGTVSVTAGVDLQSAPSTQLVTDWQWRRGVVNPDGTLVSPSSNTAWWVMLNDFQEGIGALGGGNISLTAGRDIVNVSAMIPTTGRLLGAAGTLASAGQLVIDGGGNLTIMAGRNIAGGAYDVDQGLGVLAARGALVSGATLGQTVPSLGVGSTSVPLTTPLYPILLLGNSQFDVQAASDVTLDLLANPTALPATLSNYKAFGQTYSFFYTYGPGSGVNVESVGGTLTFNNGIANLPISILNSIKAGAVYDNLSQDYPYPPTINATAMSGNIQILDGGFTMFPSASGNLRLLAYGNVTGSPTNDLSSSFSLTMLETNVQLLPNPYAPVTTLYNALETAPLPVTPLHQQDDNPVQIVALTGSISTSDIQMPKATEIVAGQDIIDLNLAAKNLNASDVTLVQAGRDISYSTPTDPVSNQLLPNYRGINVGGPGFVEVLAGRNLDLGDSSGVVSTGSLGDSRLPSAGAALVIGGGLGSVAPAGLRAPDYQNFISTYLAPSASGAPSSYSTSLIEYLEKLNPLLYAGIDASDALTVFQSLTPQQQLPLIADVLSAELSATGIAHNTQGANYQRGYDAINALFPAKDAQGNPISYQGDLNMFFSQLKTEQGGDINILDPGGSVVVGVPNVPTALNGVKSGGIPPIPAAAQLGVLVLASGAIQGFANQDFDVNQSRMLTLQGGNIILWASQGNIDAGKGAKSASGAPPPVIQTDSKGNVFVNPIGAVSGSGIGQLLTVPGLVPGLVNLIAPKGDVNAGDAGIRVAGNLNIAAVQVIGANNITVGGSSSGVPSSEAGALSGALSGANSLGDAGKSAVDQLSQSLASNANSFAQMTDTLQPAFIVVKMFCLGVDCESH